MEAGLEVFCAAGFQQAKVRDVCREAGLTQRYFYESFTTKEALLAAITDEVVTDLIVAARPGIELGATDVEVAIDTSWASSRSQLGATRPQTASITAANVTPSSSRLAA